jgi:glutamine synthetase adenylyltransferase
MAVSLRAVVSLGKLGGKLSKYKSDLELIALKLSAMHLILVPF